jgi:hypothetical protein
MNWKHRLSSIFSTTRGDLPQDPVTLQWDLAAHQPVHIKSFDEVQIGNLATLRRQLLILENKFDPINCERLIEASLRYRNHHPLQGGFNPQLSAVIYDITNLPASMHRYFPIAKTLNDAELKHFEATIDNLLSIDNFALRVWDDNLKNIADSAPKSIQYIVAGHIIEILFYRPDMLEQFLVNLEFSIST